MVSTSRSLPLTELANNFGRPADLQERSLERFLRPPGKIASYGLVKQCLPEIFGATGPMLEPSARLTGEALWEHVTRRAKSDLDNRDFNWPVVEALSSLATTSGFRAVYREFDAVTLVGWHRTKLVGNVVAAINGVPALVCLDPRRRNFLTPSGIHVVQSITHHLLRTQYPDLEDLDIAVLQFPETGVRLDRSEKMQGRSVVCNLLADRDPLAMPDLTTGIGETLSIFHRLLRERTAPPTRRTGSGGLFD